MDDTTDLKSEQPARSGRAKGIAVAVGGLLVGGVLAGTLSATAATPSPSTSTDSSTSTEDSESSTATEDSATRDESQPQRSDEELLTGDLLQQVTALAEYHGATIQRVETDSDGVYEAHLTTADGERVTVEFDEDIGVTGTEAGGGPDGHGGAPDTSGSTTDSGTSG